MNQEFKIGNFKISQDEDGYAVQRLVEVGVYQAIATFAYPEDALDYFTRVVIQSTAYKQYNTKLVEVTDSPNEGNIIDGQ